MIFFKKILRILLKTLDLGAKYGIIILLGWVLMNTAIFQAKYTDQYSDSYMDMEKETEAARLSSYLESQRTKHEHDRQIIVARMIQSQADWVIQCKIMREAYLEEKAKRKQATINFYQTARELYHLIRILEYQYPEVYDEAVPDVMKKLPSELQDALRSFPGDQIRPCEVDPFVDQCVKGP